MAKGKKGGKPQVQGDELQAAKVLEEFNKKHEGKTLTDAQKEERAKLRKAVGGLRFVRIANKRIPKALKAIEGISNLAGSQYVKTDAQVEAICKSLEAAVKDVRSKLSGVKQTAIGFSLPGFDETESE